MRVGPRPEPISPGNPLEPRFRDNALLSVLRCPSGRLELAQLAEGRPMDAASHEDIRFHRLPVEPLFELAVAVVGGIALSAAGEVLVKRLVGVVEAVLLEIEAVRAKGRIYRDGARRIV